MRVFAAIILLALPLIGQAETPPPLEKTAACLQKNDGLDDCLARAFSGTVLETRALIDAMETAGAADSRIKAACHEIVHAIGRQAFLTLGSVAGAFVACDSRCHFGCFHGVIEAAFATPTERAAGKTHLAFAEIRDRIPGFCRQVSQDAAAGLRLQCQHGLGHAILYVLNYRLEAALHGCDLLEGTDDRTHCQLGVFMENATAADRTKRQLRADDPLYPCNALDVRYRHACFSDQTRIMFHLGLSATQIALLCRGTGDFAEDCFRSLGRDLSPAVREGEPDRILRLCGEQRGAHADACIDGAAWALVDFSRDESAALSLCHRMSSPDARTRCAKSAGRYFRALYAPPATPALSDPLGRFLQWLLTIIGITARS